ncbi:MAG: alpha-L-fucosidase [Candidatus Sumerlaeota bacterium]|nr:alpha-L-fucosidase [Candidatus Sumerlaeota bacterium]
MLVAICSNMQAQDAPDAKPWLKADPKRMEAWKDLRFGMFIHWGSVSLKGTEIGWSRGAERPGVGGKGEIPADVYDNLYKQFNPTLFKADEWVQIAKDAGMKYMVLTTRHHDGFSMFDTKQSDYKITSPDCPFKRDVVKEYSEACRKAGLWLGYYHSQPDWRHPDYMTANHANYVKYLHGQARELLTNYGKVDILWFDGLGGDAKRWDAENLFKMMRGLQPDVIINNRCGLPGDWDTPEQTVGTFKINRPWETCMTICQQWAWKPDDRMKSLKECLQTLLRCVDGDGNLLFNVGPMPDGRIEPRQVERLKEMGAWLKSNGESVYGTRGGPFKPGKWGGSTHKGNTIYLHVFDWGNAGALALPAIKRKVLKGALLGGGGEAEVKQTTESITVKVAANKRQEIATVVALELDGPARDIAPRSVTAAGAAPNLCEGKKTRASNVYQNLLAEFGPDKALDGDMETRWATDEGVRQAWLEVDLGTPQTFNRAIINECVEYGARVQSFELQSKEGESWKTFHKGAKIGEAFDQRIEPVTAQFVRLNILQASDGPTIYEFQVMNDKGKAAVRSAISSGVARSAVPTSAPLSQGKQARASNVFGKSAGFAANKAVDGNKGTRWATDGGVHQAWLEVDLGTSQTFNRIVINEWTNAGERIEAFELQTKDGENWKTFHTGTSIGADFDEKFDPITAQVVRLNILRANEGPTLNEFQIFNDQKK